MTTGKRGITEVGDDVEETSEAGGVPSEAQAVDLPEEAAEAAGGEASGDPGEPEDAQAEPPEREEAALEETAQEDDDEAADDETPPEDIDEPEEPQGPTQAERLAARAALLSEARVRTLCESLLFVADRPLTEKAIQDASGLTPRRIRDAMEALGGHYREGVSGIVLHDVSGGWQLRTCPTSSEYVRRFLQVKPQRLTRAALETMAIVAYRQPVTRPEVEEIRGVDSGAVLKALLERGLVQVLGKKEEVGRPLLYGTTRAFLEFFNLKDLSSLPTLREFHELNEEHQKIVEDAYPGEAPPPAPERLLEGIDDAPITNHRHDDESVLDELEVALKEAESKSRNVAEALGDTSPRGTEPPATEDGDG